MARLLVAALLLFGFLALAFGATAIVQGTVSDTWVPANTTINVGDTVVWQWVQLHNVIGGGTTPWPDICGIASATPADLWSGQPVKNGNFTYTFKTGGVYNYACQLHCGSGMTGTIFVGPITSPVPTSGTNSTASPTPSNITSQSTAPSSSTTPVNSSLSPSTSPSPSPNTATPANTQTQSPAPSPPGPLINLSGAGALEPSFLVGVVLLFAVYVMAGAED